MKPETLDQASRLNMINRLEQERLLIAEKAQAHNANYHYFLLKNLNSLVGMVHDHRDQAAFLHAREGFRAGSAAWECAAKEVEVALNELRRQSDEYAEQLNQLEVA